MKEDLVLVTGGSGFVATHCIDQLLRAGYNVRTTVRSLQREPEVREMLRTAATPHQEALTFCEADLMRTMGGPRRLQAADLCSTLPRRFPHPFQSTRTN